MIKKSVFENELIHGMQRELQAHDKKQGMNNLVKAAEYLQAAVEIFEEAGMTAKADQVLKILGKIAMEDANEAKKDPEDKDFYEKVMKWIKEPGTPVDPENIQPGEEIEMTSLLAPSRKVKKTEIKPGEEIEITSLLPKSELPPGEDLVFQSIAQELGLVDDQDVRGKPHKPKDPTKISDSHTKGLTPEKMVKNLEQHGHPLNLADDGFADDLLNAEIGHDPLEVSELDPEKTFEDSD